MASLENTRPMPNVSASQSCTFVPIAAVEAATLAFRAIASDADPVRRMIDALILLASSCDRAKCRRLPRSDVDDLADAIRALEPALAGVVLAESAADLVASAIALARLSFSVPLEILDAALDCGAWGAHRDAVLLCRAVAEAQWLNRRLLAHWNSICAVPVAAVAAPTVALH